MLTSIDIATPINAAVAIKTYKFCNKKAALDNVLGGFFR